MVDGIYLPIFWSFRTYGIYVIRFFKNNSWRYVVVDDYLAVSKIANSRSIIFSKSKKPNEFWVSIIEKAYAKIHHCYEALATITYN